MKAPIQSGPPGTLALGFLGAVQIVHMKDRADNPASTAKIPLHLIADKPVGRPPKIVPIAEPRGAPALWNGMKELVDDLGCTDNGRKVKRVRDSLRIYMQ